MRAEYVLSEPKRIKKRILELVSEIYELRQSLLPGGLNYELDKVQGTAGGDRYEATMDRILKREREQEELEVRLLYLEDTGFPNLLKHVFSPEARKVLNQHYLYDIPVEKIAERLHMSRSTAYRLKEAGERDIQEEINKKS